MATTDRRSAVRMSRPSTGRAMAAVAITWGAAMAFVLLVAADTRIGPVIFKVTRTHGVHLGDLYATLASVIVAVLITVWIVVDHRGRRRRWDRAQRRAAAAREQWPQDAEYDDYDYDRYEEDGAADPDPDLVETVLIDRDAIADDDHVLDDEDEDVDYTGRHRPHRAADQ